MGVSVRKACKPGPEQNCFTWHRGGWGCQHMSPSLFFLYVMDDKRVKEYLFEGRGTEWFSCPWCSFPLVQPWPHSECCLGPHALSSLSSLSFPVEHLLWFSGHCCTVFHSHLQLQLFFCQSQHLPWGQSNRVSARAAVGPNRRAGRGLGPRSALAFRKGGWNLESLTLPLSMWLDWNTWAHSLHNMKS